MGRQTKTDRIEIEFGHSWQIEDLHGLGQIPNKVLKLFNDWTFCPRYSLLKSYTAADVDHLAEVSTVYL